MTIAAPRRGDVVAARLEPVEGSEQGGTRPVVVVSNDLFNEVMPVVTVVPVTTYAGRARRVYPSEVLVDRGTGGLRADSLILCHQVRTIAASRIGRRIGRLDDGAVARVSESLRIHLDLE